MHCCCYNTHVTHSPLRRGGLRRPVNKAQLLRSPLGPQPLNAAQKNCELARTARALFLASRCSQHCFCRCGVLRGELLQCRQTPGLGRANAATAALTALLAVSENSDGYSARFGCDRSGHCHSRNAGELRSLLDPPLLQPEQIYQMHSRHCWVAIPVMEFSQLAPVISWPRVKVPPHLSSALNDSVLVCKSPGCYPRGASAVLCAATHICRQRHCLIANEIRQACPDGLQAASTPSATPPN